MYVYVNQNEYAPYKKEVEDIIRHAQRIMKQKYNTTFQYKLIGSAGRHLVTKIKNGNKGYDFDYNLNYGHTSLSSLNNYWGSPTFFGWVFGFDGKVQILEPESVKEQYKQMIVTENENLTRSK